MGVNNNSPCVSYLLLPRTFNMLAGLADLNSDRKPNGREKTS